MITSYNVCAQEAKLGVEISNTLATSWRNTSVPFNQTYFEPSARPGIALAVNSRWPLASGSSINPFIQFENRNFQEQAVATLVNLVGQPIIDLKKYTIRNYLLRIGAAYHFPLSSQWELLAGLSFDYLLISVSVFRDDVDLASTGPLQKVMLNRYYRKFNASIPAGIQYNTEQGIYVKLMGSYSILPSVKTAGNRFREYQHPFQLSVGYYLPLY